MPPRSGGKLHIFFYRLLFVLLAVSIGLFLISFFDNRFDEIYHLIYFGILLAYTWYIASLLFWGEVKKDNFPAYNGEKIAVIIPCYNEEPGLLIRSINSVIQAEGNKDIFLIDDGSVKGMDKKKLLDGCRRNGVRAYFFRVNKGKRHALHFAITRLVEDHDFIVTIDSDTVLDKYALVRVVEPLKDPRVGASTGDVLLLNEKENLLTRMIGAYYWVGLNIYKKAQSAIGMVVCCSGCLAAYRTDVAKEIIEEFVNQKFLGEDCTHSEDRHLTNLVLRSGLKVKYAEKAVSYTHTPSTVKGFLKQQQRWKRGFIRESTYTLTYAWKAHPLLFLQVLLCELTVPFFAFGLMLGLVLSIFVDPMFFVQVILPSWVVFMFVRYIYILFYGKRKIPGLFIYMLFYEIFLYWQFIYALFTVKNKSWITRG